MTLFTKAASTIRRASLKAAVLLFGGRASSWGLPLMLRSNVNYQATVGDGRGSTIVSACVTWMCKTFPEAPIQVLRRDSKGEKEPVPDHPLPALLRRPNPYYSGVLLWWATLSDFNITGNAYWLKIRSGAGIPVELYWLPAGTIEPKWPDDGSEYISHYEYQVNGRVVRYDPADIVHFRYGLDGANVRKGLSPLASLFREIFTDEEAANFSSSVLKNLGVPGLVVAPEEGEISQEEATAAKADFMQRFGGDNRGQPLVMRSKTQVTVLGYSPEQMSLRELRRIPEERVSAIYGTPAVVVGLGAGLDRSTYSNMAEAREAAYESNIIPMQRLFAEELGVQLLPDMGNADTQEVAFDLSGIRVLQEDQNALHMRIREDVRAGMLTVNQGRTELGWEPFDGGDVLYVGIGVTPMEPSELLAEPEPMPAPLALPPGQPPADDDDDEGPPPPPKMRALKAGAGRKAADPARIGAAIERLRQRLQVTAQRDLSRFLADQRGRVLARLGDGSKAADPIPDATELLPLSERDLLAATLRKHHLRALNGTHSLVEDVLGIAFDLPDPVTNAFLAEAGTNIVGIADTTLDAVRAQLQEAQEAGEGLSQVAKRLRDLPAFSRSRSRIVARTELAQATNTAAVYSYRESGVVLGVQVFDGDYDEECAQMDGRIFSLEEASGIPVIAHPNCLRAFAPVTDEADMAAAA